MSEFKTKFSLNDEVFIEYNGRFLKCKVLGVSVDESICVIINEKESEGIEVYNNQTDKTIYYHFYVNQNDGTGFRKHIQYKEKNVFKTKEELVEHINVESFL